MTHPIIEANTAYYTDLMRKPTHSQIGGGQVGSKSIRRKLAKETLFYANQLNPETYPDPNDPNHLRTLENMPIDDLLNRHSTHQLRYEAMQRRLAAQEKPVEDP